MRKAATTSIAQAKEVDVQQAPQQPAKQTSFLSALKIVPMEKGATSKDDPIVIARRNVIKEIQKQQDAVKLESTGEKLPTKTFKVGDKDRTRKFAKWYFQRDGAVFTQVRYGQQSVFKDANGKPQAIEVGTQPEELLPFYENLSAAVGRGELDELLKPLLAKKRNAVR